MFLNSKVKGYVEIKGSVSVTDPSYDKNTWCRIDDVKLKEGTYRCRYYLGAELGEKEIAQAKAYAKEFKKDIEEIIRQDTNDIKHRCFALELQLKGRAFGFNSPKWKQIGEIGVDAGLAGFFWNLPDMKGDEWETFCEKMGDFSNIVYLDENIGFWSSSGYGDGWYPVYAIKEKDEVIALKVCF